MSDSVVDAAGSIMITTVAVPKGEYSIFKPSISADDHGAGASPIDAGAGAGAAAAAGADAVTSEEVPSLSLVNSL